MLEKLAHTSIGLGFASIGLSLAAWLKEKNKHPDDRERADSERTATFIGLWTPTFFVLGLYLLNLKDHGYEEKFQEYKGDAKQMKEQTRGEMKGVKEKMTT